MSFFCVDSGVVFVKEETMYAIVDPEGCPHISVHKTPSFKPS